ncbi:hypothetical protein, partial [Mycobacterium tuberculosis]|uniref:hypothetical protein n=1 Tax=Mycobacterium tuberculosis TaxID=1773 RepID=UPI00254FD207
MLSHASRGLDVADFPVKKLSYNQTQTTMREVVTPRKPLSPLTQTKNIPSTPSNVTPPVYNNEAEENQSPKNVTPIP